MDYINIFTNFSTSDELAFDLRHHNDVKWLLTLSTPSGTHEIVLSKKQLSDLKSAIDKTLLNNIRDERPVSENN